MSDDILPDDMVDELVSQLKDANDVARSVAREKTNVTDENLEEFILKTSSELIENSLDVISNVKEYTAGSPDARECQSLAELIRASASAIDTLNKVLIQRKKSETQEKVKMLDIKSKQGIAMAEQQTKVLLSREDIMKQLVKDAVDVEVIDVDQD
jgi:hypothetical protein